MKKWCQNENGSMAVYAIVMLLSFLIILSGLFLATSSVRKNQLKTLPKIKQAYEKILEEKQEILEKRRFVIYVKDQENGKIIQGGIQGDNTTIQIYTDANCINLLKEITCSGAYIWQDEIPAKGKYYVKVTDTPPGYNIVEEALEFEILDLQREVWNINLLKGISLTEPGVYISTEGKDVELPNPLLLEILRSDGAKTTMNFTDSKNYYQYYDFSGDYTWEFKIPNLDEKYKVEVQRDENYNIYVIWVVGNEDWLRHILLSWDDTGYTSKRPAKVDIKVSYADGTEQIMELNETNTWRLTWETSKEISQVSLNDNYENYTATIEFTGRTYVIIMKRNEEVPPDNPTPPENPPPPDTPPAE